MATKKRQISKKLEVIFYEDGGQADVRFIRNWTGRDIKLLNNIILKGYKAYLKNLRLIHSQDTKKKLSKLKYEEKKNNQ